MSTPGLLDDFPIYNGDDPQDAAWSRAFLNAWATWGHRDVPHEKKTWISLAGSTRGTAYSSKLYKHRVGLTDQEYITWGHITAVFTNSRWGRDALRTSRFGLKAQKRFPKADILKGCWNEDRAANRNLTPRQRSHLHHLRARLDNQARDLAAGVESEDEKFQLKPLPPQASSIIDGYLPESATNLYHPPSFEFSRPVSPRHLRDNTRTASKASHPIIAGQSQLSERDTLGRPPYGVRHASYVPKQRESFQVSCDDPIKSIECDQEQSQLVQPGFSFNRPIENRQISQTDAEQDANLATITAYHDLPQRSLDHFEDLKTSHHDIEHDLRSVLEEYAQYQCDTHKVNQKHEATISELRTTICQLRSRVRESTSNQNDKDKIQE
ncbi:hypothetical protein NW762_010526 [Fusarium torreyae]|uniref:Uncharacterized protein n=1 Tax=Fusarium torreyae TaxID=1237075 RepID=A0A9W8RUW5_9HYPO|nr:hypothetical protein NW762_010526 [Fusarium torreyae]